jgi:hypothetical protein
MTNEKTSLAEMIDPMGEWLRKKGEWWVLQHPRSTEDIAEMFDVSPEDVEWIVEQYGIKPHCALNYCGAQTSLIGYLIELERQAAAEENGDGYYDV